MYSVVPLNRYFCWKQKHEIKNVDNKYELYSFDSEAVC